jgi:hypothetical protein
MFVPLPIYKIPPQEDNGEVPQLRVDTLVVAVIEHCAFAFSKKTKNNKMDVKKVILRKILLM